MTSPTFTTSESIDVSASWFTLLSRVTDCLANAESFAVVVQVYDGAGDITRVTLWTGEQLGAGDITRVTLWPGEQL
jgi:hypothetical protein